MFIAHASSGYILSAYVSKAFKCRLLSTRSVVTAGILGALAPDIDMLYFYLVDNRQTHHHHYVTHWPILWLGLTALAGLFTYLDKSSRHGRLALMFCLAALLHLLLDTLVGDIWWFAPFVDQPYALFTVPARYQPWWLNFLLHWSFAVEIVICSWSVWLYWRRRSIQA
ncbi:metal-dependent hydrolase [Pseudomonas sp. LRF_L74]|uniref:metal-dependent hydrolase n=1 Tax=Pseudomonas sp. LRF_L74 TaxID=3369422 RepID=UPI003F608E14